MQLLVSYFFDNSPPTSSFVYNIVNNHWESREPIRVLRTGPYFIFECQNLLDKDAFLHTHTTIMDGKPITFRDSSESQIPSSLSFNMASLWIRVHDLPWRYLQADWTIRLLSHVGHVEAVDNYGSSLPLDPYLRARVLVDLTQPLIPGFFVPLEDNRVSWVSFRYEGIYRFCKECGCVGHNTDRCNLSAYDAQRIVQRRLHEFEEAGMVVLRTKEGIPLYTNMIRGLNDRFLNRNHKINLTHARPSRFVPLHDSYIYPWYYANPPADVSSSSSEEFYESSPDPPTQMVSEFSGVHSPLNSWPGQDFSQRVARSLITRFSPDMPLQGQVHDNQVPRSQLGLALADAAVSHTDPIPSGTPYGPLGFERHLPQSPPRRIFGSLGLGSWAQLSAQALRRLCG